MRIQTALLIASVVLLLPVSSIALTVEEILRLKQNGVSDTTIQMMLASEARAMDEKASGSQPFVRTIVRPDGKPAIRYSTGGVDQRASKAQARRNEERAWEMLRRLIVDARQDAP